MSADNSLSQFKTMAAEPQIGEAEATEADNEAYKSEAIDYDGARGDVNNALYGGPFTPPKQEGNQQDINIDEKGNNDNGYREAKTQEMEDFLNNNEKFKDSPYFPMIIQLEPHIEDKEQVKAAIEKLKKSSKDDAKQVVIELVESGVSDPKIQADFLKKLSGEKEPVTEKNFKTTEFYKDSQGLEIDIDKGVGGLEIMLADAYISTSDEEGNDNRQKDLAAAMEVATNNILENNSPDFKKVNAELIGEIREVSDLSEKYRKLKDLYQNDLKEDAKLGGTKAKKEMVAKKSSLKKQAEQWSVEYKKVNSMKDGEEKSKKLEELNKERQRLIREGQELDQFEGEVSLLSSGKNDQISDNDPNTLE